MVLALVAIFGSLARGANPGQPVSLEELGQTAEIIFKGTVVSSRTVDHDGLAYIPSFITQDTEFKIASIIKGEVPGNTLIFRHYDLDPVNGGMFNGRQFFHFESGKTYIGFAKRSETAGVFQQAWTGMHGARDPGVLLCTNDKQVAASNIKDVYWSELMAMLKSTDDSDVIYAIDQLDRLSANEGNWGGWGSVREFDRKNVLMAIHGLLTTGDSKVAQAAITVIGSHNPYMAEDRADFWLAAVGSGYICGLTPEKAKDENIGGKLYWNYLVAVANSKSNDTTRALAILALGLVRETMFRQDLEGWLADAAPTVRASATVLLADFPDLATHERLTVLAGDVAPKVRRAAAREIGFAQQIALSDILAKLITDPDAKVRHMAAMSLLSFSPKNEAIATIFRANLDNEEFEPLFLIALARNDPQAYLDALAKVLEQKTNRDNPCLGGGSWEILFKYLQIQPVDQITSGKFDRYLDAVEKVGNYSSSQPRDIYAFYVQRGMTDRAKRFRLEADKAFPYDLELYFKRVDENPSLYK
jgi:hypothetical protein